ncbi:cytochrome P450 [Pholiota conissans]|uniref:Cytochrome P450 n=1 Tax=Pholiota conissans TaxID=109636 RepID=A0A9P5Z0E9_9AGAR|nr:cytochrome P450 [Pholiota conissans]
MIFFLLYKLCLVLLGFNIVFLTRYLVHSHSMRRAFRHVPGPPPSSHLWGEEWELYHGPPGKAYVDWHKRFGKLVKFTGSFGHQVISITDPRAISFVLGDGAYSFPKPQGVRAWFKATLGEGILWVEGKKAHERQRRILAPALNQQSVRRLMDVFFEKSVYLANQWNKIIELQDGEKETEIEITNWAGRFALETVGRAAFSYDFDCLSGDPHELSSALDGLTNNEHMRSSFYMRALFWLVPSILYVGTKGEMIRQVKHQLGHIASKMWKDAKLFGDKDSRTLMANILKYDEQSSDPMDEEQIVSQMRTVISAGYETVSAIVAWMLYEIASHPDFQVELREEICSIPDHSFEDLNNNLPLLDAALKETLRLHPAILENHHEAGKTISIPLANAIPDTGDTQLIIPKGTLIVIPVNVMQTDPDFWGKDADSFRPRRWLEDRKGDLVKGQELLAFSVGPRSCIGRTFATMEIKTLMVTLLRKFSFRCERSIEPFQSFVIRPRVTGETSSSLPLMVKKL